MYKRVHSEEQLTNALIMILEQGMTTQKVAELTGISKRTIQRYKSRELEEETPEPVAVRDIAKRSDSMIQNAEVQDELDKTIISRAKFINEVIDTKQVVIERIKKISKKSTNLDALQRTVKTLDEIENKITPNGEVSDSHAKTINVFQLLNQNLIKQGYEGPKLTDADIVKGN